MVDWKWGGFLVLDGQQRDAKNEAVLVGTHWCIGIREDDDGPVVWSGRVGSGLVYIQTGVGPKAAIVHGRGLGLE